MKPILAIGMMSGTSVDGVVDAAAISDRWRCESWSAPSVMKRRKGCAPSIIAVLYIRGLSFHHMNQPHRGRHKL